MAQRKIRGWYWVDFRHNRIRYRKKSPINTKAGAAEYETTLRLRLARGENIDAAPIAPTAAAAETFADFSEHWCNTYVLPNNKLSERQTKRIILTRHLRPAFGPCPLASIGVEEIEIYKAQKLQEGLHPKTVNNHLAVLGRCLRSAEEWGRLPRAPQMRTLRVPPPAFDFLLPDESATLLSARSEPHWRDMVLVGLRTGLRRGELLALQRDDADLERRTLRVSRSFVQGVLDTPKSNRARTIPLTADVCAVFARAPRDGFVFGRRDERPHSPEVAEKAIKRLCAEVGLRPVGWHALRHTYASDLVAAGVPLLAVQQLLGHASITMTMRYAHLAPSALRGAVDTLEQAIAARALPKLGQPAGTPHASANLEPKAPKSIPAVNHN